VRRRHLLLTAVVMLVAVWTGVRVARSVQDARMRTDRTVDYVCSSSLRAVGTALEHYRSEHEGAWPHSVDDLVPDYLPLPRSPPREGTPALRRAPTERGWRAKGEAAGDPVAVPARARPGGGGMMGNEGVALRWL
jgi:hypothetical protein